jgi:hypothetical protein
VDVAVRFPEDIRIAWVQATLADPIADVFAADAFVLGEVHIVQADQAPPQGLPIRPRRGGDRT